FHTIYGNWDGTGLQSLLRIDANKVAFWVNNGTTHANALGTTDVPLNQWTHIAGTWDGTTIRVYFNGVEEGSFVHTGTLGNIGGSLHIGGHTGAQQAEMMNGEIDEVRVWNSTRSAPQLVAFKDQELNGGEAGLVGYWNFENGGGATIPDLATNDGVQNGTMTNMDVAGDYVQQSNVADAQPLDVTAPTPTIAYEAGFDENNSPVTLRINFGEEVIGFSPGEFTITNATFANFTDWGAGEFGVDLFPSENGAMVTFEIPSDIATDLSGNPNNTSSQFSFTANPPENALAFNGSNQQVSLLNPSALESAITTVEAWVRPDANDANARAYFALRDADTNSRFSIHISRTGNTIGVFSTSDSYATIPFTWTQGQWYHISCVIRDATTDVYIDGTYIGQIGGGMDPSKTGMSGAIGSPNDTPFATEYFIGAIDDLRVWNYERTSGDISSNYNVQLTGSEFGLVAYHHFNYDNGFRLPDLSPTGQTGFLSGMAGTEWTAGVTLSTPDVTPPVITSGPTTTNLDDNGWDFTLQLDEPGDVHWAVYTQAQPGGITNADVQGVIGDGAVGGGALSVPLANSDRTQVINGWVEPNTEHFVYLATEDGSGNLGTPSSFTVTTLVAPENAITFTSDGDYLNVGNPGAAGFELAAGDRTIEAWINMSSLPTDWDVILSNNPGPGLASKWVFGYGVNVNGVTNNLVLHLNNGSTFGFYEPPTKANLIANTWYHVALVFTGSNNAEFFLNGESLGFVTTQAATTANATVTIGETEGQGYFTGQGR
ncbi:MAG: LamG domain-containing protein, partial [Cyclobacteriaceae bacterium]